MQLQSFSISGVKHENQVDIFVRTQNGHIQHHWANPKTNWKLQSQHLHSQVSSLDISVIRFKSSIDIFFIDKKGNLVRMFKNNSTGGMFIAQVIFKQALIGSNVYALHFESHIDVYCLTKTNNLVGFASNPYNGFGFLKTLFRKENFPIHNICGLRNRMDAFNIYFLQEGTWKHANPSNSNKWTYNFQDIGPEYLPDELDTRKAITTYHGPNINIFCLDKSGYIVRVHTSEQLKWKYMYYGRICFGKCKTKDKNFSIAFDNDNIEIYYIGIDNKVYLCYIGKWNQWKWRDPVPISQPDAKTGIFGVKNKKGIDVFYINFNNDIVHCYTGERTDNNWSKYVCLTNIRKDKTPSELQTLSLSKQTLNILKKNSIFHIQTLLSLKQEEIKQLNICLGDKVKIRNMKK